MRTPPSTSIRTAWLVTAALTALAAAAFVPSTHAAPKGAPVKATPGRVLEPKDFDRLDGHGPTAKKVDVIEWEGNLEIHVYPKGSLRSLGMKIDHESKSTKNNVMVIEYGFNSIPYTLIRRAVLSIPMPDAFHAFRDETADDYDKIIVSGSQIAGAKAFALAPPPAQLYPDYHPALAQDTDSSTESSAAAAPVGERPKSYPRPASDAPGIRFEKAEEVEQDARGTTRRRTKEPANTDEDGGIRNFAF
jgi:hypothetical protein